MKTVLFKIWKFPRLSETFIVNQIVLAIELGYKVNILVGEVYDVNESSQKEIFEKYKLEDKIIVENYRIPKSKFRRLLKAFYLLYRNLSIIQYIVRYYRCFPTFSLTYLYQLHFYKKLGQFDNIHVQFGTNKHPIDLLKKTGFLKSKVIVSFHGHDLFFPINGKILNNGYYDNLFRYSNELIVNTPYLKKALLKLGGPREKIQIIPVGINTEFFSPFKMNNVRKVIRLITVGRLEYLKGQAFGIEAVLKLVEKGHEIIYTIVGEGRERKNLEKIVSENNLNGEVFLIGSKNQIEVRDLLQKQDIFLMTSITDLNLSAESQGIVTAEAQACGIPVVAFDSGGVKYTIKDNETGFLCPERDVGCYADKIEILINDSDLRSKMEQNARNFVLENFSGLTVMEKWKSIYRENL